MDDVLASIRRIIRGDRPGAGEGAEQPGADQAALPPEPGTPPPSATDAGTGDGTAPALSVARRPSAADDDDALVLGATMKTGAGQAEPESEAAECGGAPLEGDDLVLVHPPAPASRGGLSLVSNALSKGSAADEPAGSSLRGELEADLEEAAPWDIDRMTGEPVTLEPEVVTVPDAEPMSDAGANAPDAESDRAEPDAGGPAAEAEAARAEAHEEENPDREPAGTEMPRESAAEWAGGVGEARDDLAPAATQVVDKSIGEPTEEIAVDDEAEAAHAAFLAPAELEETIRRVIRDELAGEMGQRLSKNIQRMVRDEIARAMRGQD